MADLDTKVEYLNTQVQENSKDIKALTDSIQKVVDDSHRSALHLKELTMSLQGFKELNEERLGRIITTVDRLDRFGDQLTKLHDKLLIMRDELKLDVNGTHEALAKEIQGLETRMNNAEARAKGWADIARIAWLLFGASILAVLAMIWNAVFGGH